LPTEQKTGHRPIRTTEVHVMKLEQRNNLPQHNQPTQRTSVFIYPQNTI